MTEQDSQSVSQSVGPLISQSVNQSNPHIVIFEGLHVNGMR